MYRKVNYETFTAYEICAKISKKQYLCYKKYFTIATANNVNRKLQVCGKLSCETFQTYEKRAQNV